MNKKGFTLVELIAVLAVMIMILLIAIPSISSSVERNKDKFDKQKKELIETAAEIYSDLYLALDDSSSFIDGTCGIKITRLIEKDLIDYDTTVKDNGTSIKDSCVYYKDKNYSIEECGDCEL